MLILLYYLSQDPSFADKIKPLLTQLNDSKKMLDFLKDLNGFQDIFSAFNSTQKKDEEKPPEEPKKEEKKTQSPTRGIANDFIEQKLEEYFSRR